MKKTIYLLAWSMLLLGGCSEPEAEVLPAGEPAVGVRFRLEAQLDTDTSLEPMTRATAYRNFIKNHGLALILKKIESRWIVDQVDTIYLAGKPSRWSSDIHFSDNMPPFDFGVELRPGDYRIVALLNWQAATSNKKLVPGTVVADENDPALRTPPLIHYTIMENSDHNEGYRMLHREVFVAVANFTVPKSSDLHGSAMQPVPLKAERRVGKFRLMVMEKISPNGMYYFDTTAHKFEVILTSLGKPFAEGIDAMGEMYRSEEGLKVLPWCLTTVSFHSWKGERYQLCQENSTVFSPFLFIGPDEGELPFEVSDIHISGASGGFTYKTDTKFTRTLAASRISGIVFQTTDGHDLPERPYVIHVEEATDAAGNTINAAELFDEWYEWNAANDK